MKSLSLLACCLFVGTVLSSSISTSPVFLWSNTKFFNEKNSQIVSLTSVNDIHNAFSKEGSLSNYVSSTERPLEAILLFIESNIKSEEMSRLAGVYSTKPNGGILSNIKDYVENSLSSLVAPYVVSSIHDDHLVGGKLSTLFSQSTKGNIYYVDNLSNDIQDKNSSVIHLTPSQFMSSKIDLRTGSTNLIVVRLNGQLEEDNKLVRKICSSISSSSFVAIYSAEKNTPTSIEKRMPSSHESLSTFESEFAQAAIGQPVILSLAIWNDQIVTALILAIPLLLILVVGTRCLFELQSELKFETVDRKKKNN